ncbi:MAG TPA: methyltransferase domain-containing protein [Bacteriovoracaceae bacterium]|nr:methyltransferase domain-containing protein [Bacteriovoracaceae bacterium]
MSFNYESIPKGFYDKIFDAPNGVRKFWHWHKFDSVLRSINFSSVATILDVGCFSGSFIGRFLGEKRIEATGIDILPKQVEYAVDKFTGKSQKFICIQNFEEATIKLNGQTFDAVTFIEVIEHLTHDQIRSFFRMLDQLTHKGSQVVITTPNYISLWPLLEIILNRVSDVEYEEQHITKFTVFDIERKLGRIYSSFAQNYKIEIKTTSHFITPWIAGINYAFATKLSSKISPLSWPNPFGSIIILKLVRL